MKIVKMKDLAKKLNFKNAKNFKKKKQLQEIDRKIND